MGYTVQFHRGNFSLSSEIEEEICDCCNELKLCQLLPAEHNSGEIFTATLCKDCLYKLAVELGE